MNAPPSALASGPGELERLGEARGRDLTVPELRGFVEALAAAPELWKGLISHDPDQRIYRELLSTEHLTAWLICWMDDHDTGFHDHDSSAGAVAVVSGEVREQRLTMGGPPLESRFTAGDSFHFEPSDIHRVRHAGTGPAVTLHAYSPPLLRMGAYVISAEGVLARRPMSYVEELRTHHRAGAT
jgi:predicted metal-dependent enzyme (double-stranded beta helix superfamily)